MTGPIRVIGGSRRTGRHIVDRLRRGSVAVRVLSRHGGDLDAEMFLGSIADRDAVKRAASDAAGVVVIVESSEEPGPNGAQAVHFHGVENVIAAAAPTARIVLVTQIYLTAPRRSSASGRSSLPVAAARKRCAPAAGRT